MILGGRNQKDKKKIQEKGIGEGVRNEDMGEIIFR
jgi:hypothetical protein